MRAGRCGCHEWHSVRDIGRWLTRPGVGDMTLVRTWSQTGGIWRPGQCELTYADLADRIRAVGGIACGYALEARSLLSGEIELVNGLHRWAIADELGVDAAPVEMWHETESAWAWP